MREVKARALTLGDLRQMVFTHARLPDEKTILLRSELPDMHVFLVVDAGTTPVGCHPSAVYLALRPITLEHWCKMAEEKAP